jgi:MoaA/NifB/PqqE/SkfB family radical SAM enzyme
MKSNISDFPEVLRLGQELGVKHYSITNVLAHTPEMKQEILYQNFYNRSVPHRYSPKVSFPRMDLNNLAEESLKKIFLDPYAIDITGNSINAQHDSCPFIRRATTSIRWDGAVSPCLALMHTFTSFLDDRVRTASAYSIGNVNDRSLYKIWHDPVYRSLRERLRDFDFSPCVYCNSCEMALENKEDCFGNVTPACGGCLWAQELIQCP